MAYKHSLLVGFILLAIFFTMSPVTSQTVEKATQGKITIEADRMESIQKENAVSFTGNVEAKQDDLSIHADSMVIYYKTEAAANTSSPGSTTQNIDKLVAKGNIKLTKEGWVATGDTVDYFARERKVVLTGNTKVLRDNNMVTGQRIILYLDEGKSIVESDNKTGGRVTAIITPEENGQ